MSNGWFLVHNEQEWIEYKARVSPQSSENAVQWGEGPSEFPCLVTSYSQNASKMVSCYLFLAEARKLIEAGGLQVVDPADKVQAVNTVGPQQAEFNRSMWAHIRTMIQSGKDTGWITNDGYYQSMYDAQLNEVDQDEADVKRSLLDGLDTGDDS